MDRDLDIGVGDGDDPAHGSSPGVREVPLVLEVAQGGAGCSGASYNWHGATIARNL
jgi:hypothetical protein